MHLTIKGRLRAPFVLAAVCAAPADACAPGGSPRLQPVHARALRAAYSEGYAPTGA